MWNLIDIVMAIVVMMGVVTFCIFLYIVFAIRKLLSEKNKRYHDV